MSAQEADSAAESACAVLLCAYLMHRNGGGDGPRVVKEGELKQIERGLLRRGRLLENICSIMRFVGVCVCDGLECLIGYKKIAKKLLKA